jgi:hypothetical protein
MKAVFFLFSIIISLTGRTQTLQNHALYITSGLNTTSENYTGASGSLQYMYKEKFALKYGSSSNSRVSETSPRDYSGGLFSVGKPKERFSFEYITLGRVLKVKGFHLVRLNLAVGVARITEKKITEWESVDGGLFGPNYIPTTNLTESTGIIVNPTLELPLGRGIGFSISPYALFSNKFQSAGCSFNLMFGLLRGKYKTT